MLQLILPLAFTFTVIALICYWIEKDHRKTQKLLKQAAESHHHDIMQPLSTILQDEANKRQTKQQPQQPKPEK